MAPSVVLPVPPVDLFTIGITKSQDDHGFFPMNLYDDSRNLTDKQMFFLSGAFLNETVA